MSFTKYVIQRKHGVYVSIDGGETKSFHNAKMWTNPESPADQMTATYVPRYFTFVNIPENIRGVPEKVNAYAKKLMQDWKIVEIEVEVEIKDSIEVDIELATHDTYLND